MPGFIVLMALFQYIQYMVSIYEETAILKYVLLYVMIEHHKQTTKFLDVTYIA